MDGYLQILAFLLLVCSGLCFENGTLLYFNGCMPVSNLTTYEVNSTSYVQHNYPALCLQTCIQNNHYEPVAIALQDTKCVCLNRTNHVIKLGGSTNCSALCPGHHELYCGSKTVDSYSVYATSYNAIGVDEEELCAANIRGTSLRVMLNCSLSNPTFCRSILIDGSCKEIKLASNWSQELQICPYVKPQYDLYGNKTSAELCRPTLTDSTDFLTGENATFCIPAFGQHAPKIECRTLPGLMNGNATSQDNPRIVKYSCEHGYELQPNDSSTRFCTTNGNWNGTDPTCTKLGTTTSSVLSNITGPLTSGLTTRITAAASTQTSLVTKLLGTLSASLTVSTSSPSKPLVQTTSFQTTEVSESIFNQTTESNSSSASAESKSDSGSAVGTIVGVIVGVAVCAVLAAGIIIYWKPKQKVVPQTDNRERIRNMEEDVNQE